MTLFSLLFALSLIVPIVYIARRVRSAKTTLLVARTPERNAVATISQRNAPQITLSSIY